MKMEGEMHSFAPRLGVNVGTNLALGKKELQFVHLPIWGMGLHLPTWPYIREQSPCSVLTSHELETPAAHCAKNGFVAYFCSFLETIGACNSWCKT